MASELGHELGKLILYCHVGGNTPDLYGIQLGGQHFFFVRIQVHVGLPGGLDFLMAKPLGYHQDIEPHLNQEGGAGVPKS